jgi:vitamin B12 transporter
MKKVVLITMLMSLVQVFHAQSKIVESQNREENILEITGDKRTPQTPIVDGNITVISKQDIQKLPARNVAEVLMTLAGVDVRSRNPLAQNDISLYGASFDQILILIDGIPMRDPQTGHHQMNLPVDLSQIASIQVYKGSAARIFGAGALAGAINIVTIDPGTQRVNIQSTWGSNFQKDTASGEQYISNIQQIGLGFKRNQWGNNVQIRRVYSNGYAYNTGVEQQSIFSNSRWKSEDGKSQVQIINGYLNNSFGAKDFYASPWDVNAKEQVETYFSGVNGSTKIGNWQIVPRLYYRYNHDHYVFIKDNPSYYQNHHFSTTVGAELHASTGNAWGLFGFGLENRNDWIRSNNLGKHDRQFYSGYAEQRFLKLKNISVIVGMNIQYCTQSLQNDQNKLQLYPAIDINYKKGKGLFYAHAGSGSRLPTYTDLYYKGQGNQGNPNLLLENGCTIEAGYSYKSNDISIQGNYFYRNVTNQIDYVLTPDGDFGSIYLANNVGKCTFAGTEILTQWNNPNNDAFLRMDKMQIKATLLSNSFDAEGMKSKYVSEHLSNQMVFQMTIGTGKMVQHQIIARRLQRMGQSQIAMVYDWRTQANINSQWNVFADVSNMTDLHYKLSGQVFMPGRYFNVGVNYILQ